MESFELSIAGDSVSLLLNDLTGHHGIDYLLGRIFDCLLMCLDYYVRIWRGLVWITYAGEVLDGARASFLVQTLNVTLLASL